MGGRIFAFDAVENRLADSMSERQGSDEDGEEPYGMWDECVGIASFASKAKAQGHSPSPMVPHSATGSTFSVRVTVRG
jgi:hypothetical protein